MEQYNYVSGKQAYKTQFMAGVFAWMAGALALTAVVAYSIVHIPQLLLVVVCNKALVGFCWFVQVVIAISFSGFLHRMSFTCAAALYTLYSMMMGVSFTYVLLLYTGSSVASIFLISASMFLALSLYGFYTKRDLSVFYTIGFMLLVGLLVGGLVNYIIGSSHVDFMLSIIGVGTFSLLTAVDMQSIKRLSESMDDNGQDYAKMTILGALILYLDFINLYLYLLRLLGRRR
ncbi:MAG: Bax inhibitor-1/YccA family protein [Candidatus Babeliales bacterium]